MHILIVGNIIKDVYLNLDSRTEAFEPDSHGINWLDLSFDASEHHFFSRASSLGGAAISLEVLQNLGLDASINGSNLDFSSSTPSIHAAAAHRYILVSDSQVTYFAPTTFANTSFSTPDTTPDYLYLDRSALITPSTAQRLLSYLDQNPQTKLIFYFKPPFTPHLEPLLNRASLIFSEVPDAPELASSDPATIITVTESCLRYLDITEPISINRNVDVVTHLSLYSIASATILGCFILGHSVESSLKLARLNVEHSRLDSTLSLAKLQDLASHPHTHSSPHTDLELIASSLVLPPKGILAADESGGSIHKKFAQLDIPDTFTSRRDYRNLLLTTPRLNQYVNGVILFDETAHQTADDGQNFVNYLTSYRIIPGIKVDQGLVNFDPEEANPETTSQKPHPEETYTKGLDGLSTRLQSYYQMGLRFAKWRAAFNIRLDSDGQILTPTPYAIAENCRILAEYASACQSAGLVPIVEPEVVYDGDYIIAQSATVTAQVLDQLFSSLKDAHVNLRACLLKCNMVLAGKNSAHPSTPTEVGTHTAEVLKNHVPSELAGVVFLSGGQTPEQATDNLAAITNNGPYPWPVTFSFARALQDPALYAWKGDNANTKAAQTAFLDRLAQVQAALKPNQ